ncbi:MAG: hypothetical protein ACLFUS_12585 [Candidatus Sumerlaeia bacterium]
MSNALSFPNPTMPIGSNSNSKLANSIWDLISQVPERLYDSSLGWGKRKILDELSSVFEESCKAGWDGQEAIPVSSETLRLAEIFLLALPDDLPFPSPGAEPDGQITFEWYTSKSRIISISIDPQSKLHYAALIGPSKAYGTERFYDQIPEGILRLIRRVANN